MLKFLHARRAGLMVGALLLSAALAPPLAAQNLFVSSTNTKSVIEYDGETGDFESKFARGGGLIEPEGLEFGPDGDLYVASRSDEILRYDGEKGNFKGVFASGHGLADPAGIAFGGPDNDLYVASGLVEGGGGGNQILRFDGETGAFEAVLDPANLAGLTDPEAVVFGPDGLLYVTDTPEVGNGPVLRYDPATNAFHSTFIPAAASIPDPTGMVFSPDGQFLFLSSAATSEVRKYNGATGAPLGVFVAPGGCGLNEAEGMVFLNGNLLVASELSDEVIEFNGTTGACIGPFVTAGSGNLSEPTFMTLGASDSDEENDAFRFRVPKP